VYLPFLCQLLSCARKEVSICAFQFYIYRKNPKAKSNLILKAIRFAIANGANVQVILNAKFRDKPSKEMHLTTSRILSTSGASVRMYDISRCLHSKMVIIDNEHLIIGSSNWTEASLVRNVEANLYLQDPQTIEEARQWFENLWQNAT